MPSSWSFSKLGDFEKCKKYFWLKHEQKVPEPERPLPPGKAEHANDRGSRIHDSAEHFVDGSGPFIRELEKFKPEFEQLRHLHTLGKVSLEGEWGMSRDWEPCGWHGDWQIVQGMQHTGTAKKLPDRGRPGDVIKVGKVVFEWVPAWQRSKIDALVFVSDIEAVVIDYKTGRKFGNEVKHAQQLQLYQLNTFLRYPQLEVVHCELWYTDQDDITSATYTRDQGLRFKRAFHNRGAALTDNTMWPANPNIYSCQYCGYGPWGTNDCPRGVKK